MSMSIRDFKPQQFKSYFEARLGRTLHRDGVNVSARCPFHQDAKESLSVNLGKGVWKCHAGCGEGGLIEFEKHFSSCDASTAYANIAELLGLQQRHFSTSKPEAVYPYCDEACQVVIEKLRYPAKKFAQRKPDANGGWEYKLGDIRRPLYELPKLITANQVLITEGEKDADRLNLLNLSQLDKSGFTRVAATTNIEGASKWRPEYNPYFTGKAVAIFPDNDETGERRVVQVAASVFPYAYSVRIVCLPGLPPKGDVSDYLDSHSAADLVEEIKKTPLWSPPEGTLLVRAEHFNATVSEEIDWRVYSVIQRGANGFMCGPPKGGKTWVAIDMAASLALGVPWMEFSVPQPMRTALITREDNPQLTKWRLRQLVRGKGKMMADLGGRLYINSREQSGEFRLDQQEQLCAMVVELKAVKSEFVILDVFNILHGADENDNTEMRNVLDQLNFIKREVGCDLCVLHHYNKTGEGTMTQRLRGSSAIAGWAEWLIGIEPVNAPCKIRKMQFELKAAMPPEDIMFKINSDEGAGLGVRIERVSEPESFGPGSKPTHRRPEDLLN